MCPGVRPTPYSFLSTVLYILTFKKLPDLDKEGRPKFAYGRMIHELCERRPHFDAGRFALEICGPGGINRQSPAGFGVDKRK